jgi:alpha-beta hydrolase superfamily lysophospholipase
MISIGPRLRRWLKRTATAAVVLVLIWLAVSFGVAYKLTRRPHAPFAEPPPSVAWATIEPVRLRTSDGLELGAWYMPGRPDSPSAVLMHGYRSRRSESMPLAAILVKEGYGVLAVTLRAHGDSEGDYTDVGYSSWRDVVAAVAWLETRRPGKPILVQGTSMGAAAAIYAADELQMRVSAYILECPFDDIRSAIRHRISSHLPWPLDNVAYAGLRLFAPIFLPDLDRMAPVKLVAAIPATVPVLVMAGGRDQRARPAEVRAVHERIAGHARLVVFPEADHGHLSEQCGEAYRAAVLEFIRKK